MSPQKQTKQKSKKEQQPDKAVGSHTKWSIRSRPLFIGMMGFFLSLGVLGTVYAFVYNDRYLPRTHLGGVSIGGRTRAEAEELLKAKQHSFLEKPLHITHNEKSWDIAPAELETSITYASQLDELWKEEKQGSAWGQLALLFSAPVTPRYADVSMTALGVKGQEVLKEKVLGSIETAFEETTLSITPLEVKVVPGKAGERLDQAGFEDDIATAFEKNTNDITLHLEPSQPEVTTEMAEPARLRAEEILAKPLQLTLADKAFAVDQATLAEWLTAEVARDTAKQATGLQLVLTSKAGSKLTEWAATVNRAAANVRLATGADGKVTVVEGDVDGRAVHEEKTLAAVLTYIQSTATSAKVVGEVEVKKADVRADTLASLGIQELVGTATTDYAGSPNNRKFNIAKGARDLDRKLVKPGETFSTTKTLGPIEESTGYLPELVIKGNRTTPEAGGGLCQVSTTLFRSVLNAGLPIVERQNHAYRVSYYELGVGPGLDATIYDPSPDFKWKNDFGTAVYVQSKIVGTKITFDLFGTKDGRSSVISPPQIIETYKVGDPIYSESDTVLRGQTKQIERAHDGAKTSVTYVVNKDGKDVYKRTFISVYKAWPAQYLVGTGTAPEPTPTPTPAPAA
ncbi:MAG TPA: VanW family protein [Verrucomicrobiae bacterium]|nr:VanW family protein [Verrucomicrobiae bacterium]